jgi:predicted dehydrogenase
MQPIKAAVIGCGWAARNIHIPYLKKDKDVRLIAVCDVNVEVASKTSKLFNIPKFYTDLDKMLEQEDLDLLHITTPLHTHAPIAIKAIEHGCNVLTEKPMALSVQEAKEIVAAVSKKRVKFCVVHQDLFLPVVEKARSMMENGSLGRLIAVRTIDAVTPETLKKLGYLNVRENHWLYRIPHAQLFDGVPHTLSLQLMFLKDVYSVYAIAKKYGFDVKWAEYDHLTVLLDSEDKIGVMELSMNSPYRIFAMDLYGTKMNLHIDLAANFMIKSKLRYGTLGGVLNRYSESLQGLFGMTTTLTKYFLRLHYFNVGHYRLFRKFIQCIKHDTPPPLSISAEGGLKVIEVIEDISKQIERQRYADEVR